MEIRFQAFESFKYALPEQLSNQHVSEWPARPPYRNLVWAICIEEKYRSRLLIFLKGSFPTAAVMKSLFDAFYLNLVPLSLFQGLIRFSKRAANQPPLWKSALRNLARNACLRCPARPLFRHPFSDAGHLYFFVFSPRFQKDGEAAVWKSDWDNLKKNIFPQAKSVAELSLSDNFEVKFPNGRHFEIRSQCSLSISFSVVVVSLAFSGEATHFCGPLVFSEQTSSHFVLNHGAVFFIGPQSHNIHTPISSVTAPARVPGLFSVQLSVSVL